MNNTTQHTDSEKPEYISDVVYENIKLKKQLKIYEKELEKAANILTAILVIGQVKSLEFREVTAGLWQLKKTLDSLRLDEFVWHTLREKEQAGTLTTEENEQLNKLKTIAEKQDNEAAQIGGKRLYILWNQTGTV